MDMNRGQGPGGFRGNDARRQIEKNRQDITELYTQTGVTLV